jgi:hypothetical protein
VDERRLYDVGRHGGAWTIPSPEEGRRHVVRLRWLFALGLAANAASWTLAGVALALGGEAWGAAFGLLAIVTTPLLVLPSLVDAAVRLRTRRRHRQRPPGFPAG